MAGEGSSKRRSRGGWVRRQAHAKVNLFLRVLGAREDGYHELESLVVPTSLADRVSVRAAEGLRVTVKGAGELTRAVEAGGLNLALVAALVLAEECGATAGAEIAVEKRIPVAGGLGGGSADAAATIDALNELWNAGLSAADLAGVAARIGSDVPALLAGVPLLMKGRGDTLEPLEVGALWWVLVPMSFGVRSPEAYLWWDKDGGSTGSEPTALLAAARAGDAEALGPLLFNDLEEPVFRRHPAIRKVRDGLLADGALGAVMSGSGSTVAGLARDRAHARAVAKGFEGAIVVSGPPERG
jgi:4-diphosphocytidyl-2-C-methyl-D-erythritol kinase